jgi:hypothetical protein
MKKIILISFFALLCIANLSVVSGTSDGSEVKVTVVSEANASSTITLLQSQFGCSDLENCNNPNGQCPNFGGEIGECLIGCNGGAWLYCDGCPSCPGEG